ncbi:HEXXH motif-containing putative peptide modification protein [Streptomyces sp. NPDC049555]|uniref:aKG-HExxH-type peptide beta-hydroxylase n=1 Tax=unclassified Streptomyces TaxID=2593676 RepID=UPI00341B3918
MSPRRPAGSPAPPAARPEPAPLPAPVLARLARTRSVPGDLALLLSALHSRRLVLLKSLLTRLEEPAAAPDGARARFEEHWLLLERAEVRRPHLAGWALDYPPVGTWLTHALTAPDGAELARALEHFGAVAAAVALTSGTDFTLDLPAPGGALALPGIGTLTTRSPRLRLTARGPLARLREPGGPTRAVLLRSGGRVTGAGPGWHGLVRLPGSTACLDDLDPYRTPPAGVGRAALPPADRGAHRDWPRHWRSALALLRDADPVRAAEVTALLRCLVPLAPRDGGSGASATFRAAPGAVLATPPGTAAALAEVLVHETQHSKLAVLHDLAPLHRASAAARHRVPWRPDPRPLGGVLQGTYAHLALADFWARAARRPQLAPRARHGARARRDSYLRQVAQALPVLLESAELTAVGRQFAAAMERHRACLEQSDEHIAEIDALSRDGDVG